MSNKIKFTEAFKVVNGQFDTPEKNLERLNKTMLEAYGVNSGLELKSGIIPANRQEGIVKCRIVYSNLIEQIEYIPYSFREVKTLKLVPAKDIDYSRKYADRTQLENLLKLRGNCDDILITVDGFITDTSYSNVAFFDGYNYYTPSTYLLNGTKRQQLLENGRIKEKEITVNDLKTFQRVFIINTMIDLEDNRSLDIKNIQY